MKRLAINANGNTITSFTEELNPMGVGKYISLLSSTDRSVSFYQNSSVWLDILASRNWDRNPFDSNTNYQSIYVSVYIYIYIYRYIDRWIDNWSLPWFYIIWYTKRIQRNMYVSMYLFGFYGISTFVGYLMPNQFLYK